MQEYEKQKLVMAIYGAEQHLNNLVKLNGKYGKYVALLESITETHELIEELHNELKEKTK